MRSYAPNRSAACLERRGGKVGDHRVCAGGDRQIRLPLRATGDTKGHPAGTKTGDAIHVFQSGSIQMVTDVSIDPAGNARVANNWNNPETGASSNSARPTSTWGGGDGIVVIYGVAAPVKTPLMGQVQGN